MPLGRREVDNGAGKHIRQLEELRHVPDVEKQEIRKLHEETARKVDKKRR